MYTSPLRASIDQRDLPPVLIITAEADVLRDEGEAYGDKLREAGVEFTKVRYQGSIHAFVVLNALADMWPPALRLSLASAWLKDGFQQWIMERKVFSAI
nr:alpha/beta hydrolase fold domain-containing protein [Paenibacillus physcomitrellae]